MPTPSDTVTKFLQAWEPNFGYRAALREYLSDGCVYENVGLTNTTGVAAAEALMEGFNTQMGFTSMRVEILGQVAAGNTVMNERVDHLHDAQGKRLMSLRVMGVFDVRDGKIAAWRDYFDTVPFRG
jgi:limonene-1,2-epoxide hydrolase